MSRYRDTHTGVAANVPSPARRALLWTSRRWEVAPNLMARPGSRGGRCCRSQPCCAHPVVLTRVGESGRDQIVYLASGLELIGGHDSLSAWIINALSTTYEPATSYIYIHYCAAVVTVACAWYETQLHPRAGRARQTKADRTKHAEPSARIRRPRQEAPASPAPPAQCAARLLPHAHGHDRSQSRESC